MGWRKTVEMLRGHIATCEIAIRGKGVAAERVAAMHEHLRRFVDKEALYVVRTEDQIKMMQYLLEICELLAEREDEPTHPDAQGQK